MFETKKLKKVSIYVGEEQYLDDKPLYRAVIEKCFKAGLLGATVIKAVDGYGKNTHMKKVRLFNVNQSMPLIVEIIDTEDKINKVIEFTKASTNKCFIVLEDVEVVI